MKYPALSEKGMTLVELLVAGTISVIVAGVILVIYLMYNSQIRESNGNLSLQIQYENIAEQVASRARTAHKIFERTAAYQENCLGAANAASVLFYNTAGVPIGGIGISNDTLVECKADLNWIAYDAGNGIVRVDTASFFVLNGCRNGIELHLTLKKPEHDTTYYFGPGGDVFLCRN